MDDQKSGFLRWNLLLVKMLSKSAEMTTRGIEYYIDLLKNQQQVLRGLAPILKEVLLWVKCYQTALHVTEKLLVKGRVNQCNKLHCYFKKLPQPPNLQPPPPGSVSSHQH